MIVALEQLIQLALVIRLALFCLLVLRGLLCLQVPLLDGLLWIDALLVDFGVYLLGSHIGRSLHEGHLVAVAQLLTGLLHESHAVVVEGDYEWADHGWFEEIIMRLIDYLTIRQDNHQSFLDQSGV